MIVEKMTMKFNGERLRKARLYRDMSVVDLAEKINISRQEVHNYERNIRSPKADTFFSIASVLRFPPKFFIEKDKYELGIENTFFDKLSTIKKINQKTEEVKTEFVIRIYNFLVSYLSLPELNLPDVSEINLEDIESVASYTRQYWGLEKYPIENMVHLLESNGIIVADFGGRNKSFSTSTQVYKNNDFEQFCIALGADMTLCARQFDCAHGLGHILLHNSLGDISLLENDEQRKIKLQANQFAGAFLLPKDTFYNDLLYPDELGFYLRLKQKWKVSIKCMIVRARQLEIITHSEYQKLMRKYNKWRYEPLDDELSARKPVLFKESLYVLDKSKVFSNHQFLDKLSSYGLSLNATDVEELLSLKKGCLATVNNPIKEIKPRLKEQNSLDKNNEVIR